MKFEKDELNSIINDHKNGLTPKELWIDL